MKIMIYRFKIIKMSVHIRNRYIYEVVLVGNVAGLVRRCGDHWPLGTCSSLPRTGTRSPPPPPLQHQPAPAPFSIISFHPLNYSSW